jgi:predicted Fe-Mo cluster-binding NifX family protein
VPHFGRAPSFAIIDLDGNSYRIVEIFQNPFLTHSHGRGVGIVNELAKKGVNTLVSLGAGYGAYYRLRELSIKIYYVTPPNGKKTMTLQEAIEMFLSGKPRKPQVPERKTRNIKSSLRNRIRVSRLFQQNVYFSYVCNPAKNDTFRLCEEKPTCILLYYVYEL